MKENVIPKLQVMTNRLIYFLNLVFPVIHNQGRTTLSPRKAAGQTRTHRSTPRKMHIWTGRDNHICQGAEDTGSRTGEGFPRCSQIIGQTTSSEYCQLHRFGQ